MAIKLELPDLDRELKPRITVFGVGGAGGNAVKNMIDSGLEGVEFVAANTDAQALGQSSAERKIQMGVSVTQGLGAGSHPEIGRAAAEEALPEILENLHGSHMVFVTSGMGGGTGTGASPVIAAAAREQGILTLGVVTKPFQFEGSRRMRIAEEGVAELQKHVDTLLVIPNQNLFRIANEKTTFADAFTMADRVLHSGVASITDLMVKPGLINLDFADVRSVMDEMGKAMMGTGEASGDGRSLEAAQAAISNPLLDDVSMKGARGVLINITGGMDMTLYEVDEAANHVRAEVDADCNIIIGSTFDPELEGIMRVAVVATGIDGNEPELEEQPWDRDNNGSLGKVCSIHSMSSASGRGARMESGAPNAEAQAQDMRVVLPARKPISLGHVERSAPAPTSTPPAAPIDSHDEAGYEAEVIFNTPSKPEVSEEAPASEEVAALEPAVQPSTGMADALGKSSQERGSFWNFWSRGSKQGRRVMHPSPTSSLGRGVTDADMDDLPEPLESSEEDQLEIPAFLRRQAN